MIERGAWKSLKTQWSWWKSISVMHKYTVVSRAASCIWDLFHATLHNAHISVNCKSKNFQIIFVQWLNKPASLESSIIKPWSCTALLTSQFLRCELNWNKNWQNRIKAWLGIAVLHKSMISWTLTITFDGQCIILYLLIMWPNLTRLDLGLCVRLGTKSSAINKQCSGELRTARNNSLYVNSVIAKCMIFKPIPSLTQLACKMVYRYNV